jgi:hypothetical protein
MFSNNKACAIAAFSQAVDAILCNAFELIFFLNCSSANKLITALVNCCGFSKSIIIPASFCNTSSAWGIGVEMTGQPQLMA